MYLFVNVLSRITCLTLFYNLLFVHTFFIQGTWNVFTQLAFVAIVVAGAKLQMVNSALTREVYVVHKCLVDENAHGKNSVDPEKLHVMQLSTASTSLDKCKSFCMGHNEQSACIIC